MERNLKITCSKYYKNHCFLPFMKFDELKKKKLYTKVKHFIKNFNMYFTSVSANYSNYLIALKNTFWIISKIILSHRNKPVNVYWIFFNLHDFMEYAVLAYPVYKSNLLF